MSLANITVTQTAANVQVDVTNTTVTVAQTTSNVIVGPALATSNADIRAALSNVSPVLYDSTTGVISFDNSVLGASSNVVANGNQGGDITLDIDAGAYHTITPTSNITGITLTGLSSGESATLVFTQNSTGGVGLDTTSTPSNWSAWEFAGGATVFDLNPLHWSVISIFGIGTTGSPASEYYASVVVEESTDSISNLIVTGNITAGNVSATTFTGTTFTGQANSAATLSNHTTAGLAENTNLYYTDVRSRAALSVTQATASGAGTLDYSSVSGVFTYTPPDLTAFGLTNAQAQAYIQSNGLNATANLITTANTSAVHGTFTGAQSITATGNVSIGGNLTVTGNIDSETVRDLLVEDRNITLGYGTTGVPSANSQIIIDRGSSANTYLKWDEGSDSWKFSNNGTTEFVLPESTSTITEGTNLYYTDARSQAAVSTTTTSASGGGALAYDNSSGVFTFTPADLSLGISNAQAQAFIQTNGLSMTANIDSTKSINLTYPDTVLEGIVIKADTPNEGTTILDVTSARSGDSGPQTIYRKATGSIASPGAIGTRDYVRREKFFGHDGTQYLETMGTQVYQDSDVGGVSTDVVPLAYEIYTEQGGDVNHGYNMSIVRFDSDRNIIFNDTGTRTFGSGQGNANITMDGSINTVSNITALGNISGGNILGIGGVFTGDVQGLSGNFGNIDLSGSASANTISIPNNGILSFEDNNGTINGVQIFNASNQINCLQGNVYASKNSAFSYMTGGIGLTNVSDGTIYNGYSLAIGESRPQGTIAITVDGSGSSTPPQSWHKYELNGYWTGGSRDESIRLDYYRSLGTNASPTVVGDNDIIQENRYHGYDGTQYYNGAKDYVYHDTLGGAASSNNMKLTREFTSMPGGLTSETSRLRLCANGTIQFNTNGVLENGTNGGNASILIDGTINSAANITATGNITGAYILGNGSLLTGLPATYNDANVISLLGAYTNPISTTANLDLNIATAVDNLYGVRFDSATNKFISSPTLTAQAPTHFITVEKETTDLEFIRSRVARSGAFGTKELYEKSEGTLASPTVLGTYDEIWQAEYAGWDGAKYEDSLGVHTFQDGRTASVSADTVPLAYEVYGKLGGDTTGPDWNFLSVHSDGKIVFNDGGYNDGQFGSSRGNNLKIGTANISRDGSFVSNANITAVGNITGNYFKGDGSELTNLPTGGNSFGTVTVSGQTNIQATQANAQIEYVAGAGITLTTSANALTITGSGGSYGNTEVSNYLGANVQTGNIETQGNIVTTQATANVVIGGGHLKTDNFSPFTAGARIVFPNSGVSMEDVKIHNIFYPSTGGNTNGAIIVGASDSVATWQTGYVFEDDTRSGPEIINVTNPRSTSVAIEEIYKRARGSTASPTVLSANDRIHEAEYYGHDGTNYLETFGEHTYVDTNAGTIGTGVMPLAKEFYTRPNGVLADGRDSVMKIRANRAIEFNAPSERSFTTDPGNANVTADGSINSVSTITGLNIKSNQFVQLKNYTTAEINALTGMAAGDTVYNTTLTNVCVYNGSAWRKIVDETM